MSIGGFLLKHDNQQQSLKERMKGKKNRQKKSIALVGATGAVGQELLGLLQKRDFPVDWQKFYLLASKRSAQKKEKLNSGQEIKVHELTHDFVKSHPVDIAFFSAGSTIAKEYAPLFSQNGAIVIDNSSCFRMDSDVPLVIPEINGEELKRIWKKKIYPVANCSTIIMLMALAPLIKYNRIRKIIVSTYQAASGAGNQALQELLDQANHLLAKNDNERKWQIFPQILAFNAFSHDSPIDEQNGSNDEEKKIIIETQKILEDPTVQVFPTCIRIGTFRAHAQSIYVEVSNPVELAEIRKQIQELPGIDLQEDYVHNIFPTPQSSSGQDNVKIGRIRHCSGKNTLQLWCCGDQLLKGAALNAVQIAEKLNA